MFTAVSKQSLSDAVFDQLRSRILSDDLHAGEELPSERVLCELLNVHRGAVREAIKRLQQSGLVAVRHGGATQVLDYRQEAGPDLLSSLLVSASGDVEVDVARGVVRMRQVLSPEIAADAASQRDPLAAHALADICQQMGASKETAALQLHALAFWDLLVDASNNIAYRLAMNSLRKTYAHIGAILLPVMEKELQDLASFVQITEAVRAGNRQQAFDYAKVYIDNSSAAINTLLDQLEKEQQHPAGESYDK
ncbi:MAG: FadR/GntR family transcriptional regulator [Spongiibacteraceae bacterium]